jgi:hypothetical protein
MAWMACHFSPYGTGLSNLPPNLPANAMVILNDRTPIHGHDSKEILCQLNNLTPHCLLLDFQRQAVEETAAPAALPAPEAEPAKAAQTFEEIMAQVKAEEEAELAGASEAKEDIPAEEEGVNVPVEEPKPEETKAEENAAAISAPAEEKVQEEIVPREETEKAIIIPSNRRSSRKKKKQLASVLEMLREYEEEDARNIPKIEAQLMLNLDDAMESLIESPKK